MLPPHKVSCSGWAAARPDSPRPYLPKVSFMTTSTLRNAALGLAFVSISTLSCGRSAALDVHHAGVPSDGGAIAGNGSGGVRVLSTGGMATSGTSIVSTGGLPGSRGMGGAGVGDASACASDQDCPSSQVCGYEADLTCSTRAHCIPAQFCNSVQAGCGCDGSLVLLGCGVASRAFAEIGSCRRGTGGAPGTAVPVSASQLMGTTVSPCASGYAHPSICCQGAPDRATTCTEDVTHPFDVCGTEQLAYPDSSVCCSLGQKTACVQPSGVDANADAGLPSPCLNPCYPGAYPPPPFLDSYLCVFGNGGTVETTQPACIGMCYQQGDWCSTPCPAGWSAPAGGQVDLCCMTDSSGQTFCFSQAGYIGGTP
jgi:hypothetical protein